MAPWRMKTISTIGTASTSSLQTKFAGTVKNLDIGVLSAANVFKLLNAEKQEELLRVGAEEVSKPGDEVELEVAEQGVEHEVGHGDEVELLSHLTP